MNRIRLKLFWVICFLAIWPGLSQAALVVQYQATDVADVTPGLDTWQYHYIVSGNLDVGGGFTLVFDESLYSDLALLPPFDPVWFSIVTQPDPGLPASGLVSQTNLGPGTAFNGSAFDLQFTWLGAGTPGSQPFDVLDGNGDFVASGATVLPGAVVPEPGPASLMLAGLLALLVPIRRMSSAKRARAIA
jgi:hypothetical protein